MVQCPPMGGLCVKEKQEKAARWKTFGIAAKGATVIVIEHDLDLIRNADYVIDMGPGGGDAGGQIVCAGTPADIAACPKSVTGRYL